MTSKAKFYISVGGREWKYIGEFPIGPDGMAQIPKSKLPQTAVSYRIDYQSEPRPKRTAQWKQPTKYGTKRPRSNE